MMMTKNFKLSSFQLLVHLLLYQAVIRSQFLIRKMLSIINYVLYHHASTMNHITISHTISLHVVEIGDGADKNYDDGDGDVIRPVLFIHRSWKIENQRILETYDQLPVKCSG